MNNIREGGSVTRPPLFNGTNYVYWKSKMKAFIKSLDEKAWCTIEVGWSLPTTKDESGEQIPKEEAKWTATEQKLALANNKALYAIFNAVDEEQFKLISSCEMAKEA